MTRDEKIDDSMNKIADCLEMILDRFIRIEADMLDMRHRIEVLENRQRIRAVN